MADMLTVSSLPGLVDLAPVKPTVGSAGGFAPLIARLLGGEIKVDCISLPSGGEMLPVTMPAPVSFAEDAPAEPPAILVVPGSPSLVDPVELPAALPIIVPIALPVAQMPVRFAPIAVPVALAASPPPATDPVLPAPVPMDATEEPRPAAIATRTALLTSTATPPPVTPAPAPTPVPTARPPLDSPAPMNGTSKPVASGRKNATTEPASSAVDDDPRPATAPAPAPVRIDSPIVLEVDQPLLAPVPAPPPAENPPAMTAASTPIVAPRAAPRATVAAPAPGAVDVARLTARGPAREVEIQPSPAAVPPVNATTTSASAEVIAEPKAQVAAPRQARAIDPAPPPIDIPSMPLPDTAPAAVEQPARAMAPTRVAEPASPASIASAPGNGPAIVAAPSRTAPVIAAGIVQQEPTAVRPIAQPAAAITTIAPAITPPLDGRYVVAPRVATDPVAQTTATTATPLPVDVMVPPDMPRREAAATEHARSTAVTPATTAPSVAQQAAAPVILPALQAFGAAIRRAMADERKPASSGDDTILGLSTLAATAAPATAQAIAPGDTTLDTADRRWPHAMAEQIEKLRDAADAQSTRIRLLPDALGPVDVAVRRDGDQVHVHFAAADAQTRQLLADAQPRLADAAEARGLKLGRTDVSGSGGDLTGGGERQQQRPATQNPQPSRPAPARARAATADIDDSRLA